MTEELKMDNFDIIKHLVAQEREHEISIAVFQKNIDTIHGELVKFGINCNSITNCVDAGKLCYKCQNNYARRSYFRDLLRRGVDVSVYSADASCFNAVKEE